ncbi:MAG: oligosaccharide flippase family protein [Clostridia bacterium]|nr:oligosaccharide flippase family protein [Clostridia bacterium]
MKVNQLKAGVILSYLSEGIMVLSGLIYTPIMLRLLGQSQYGLYQLSSSVIAYLSLLSLGFGSSYVRYYSRYKVNNDKEGIAKLNGMFMTVFTVIAVICILAGSVLVFNTGSIFKKLTADEIKTAKVLMGFMIFNLAISFPGSVFTSHITANEQYIFVRIVNLLKHLLNPFLTIPLLLLGFKSVSLVVIQTILSVSAFTANMYFCKMKLKMTFDFKNLDKGLLIELFMFSFWIFLNQIIDQINWNIGKLFLGMVRGTTAVAIFGVASQLNSMYVNFSSSISTVFTPRVNRIVAKNDDNRELTALFTKIGRIQFLVLTLLGSGLIFFGNYFINVWAGKEYFESYRITLLLILPAIIPLIQNIGIEIQRAKNLHKFRAIIYSVMAIINVIICYPMSIRYGATGAAIGTAVSLLVGNGLIMNIFYHKKVGLDIIYFWKQILSFVPALILPAIAGILILKFVSYKSILMFILLIGIYTLTYCISMWLFGMNKYEKDLVTDFLKKFKRK